MINFSGYTWKVRNTLQPSGPGPNIFSDDPENVWVDEQGDLHLRITFRNEKWNCCEVELDQQIGHGIFQWFLIGDLILDPNVVFGMFLYKSDDKEFDIEISRWGIPAANPLQYVVQPAHIQGNMKRFPLALQGNHTTHRILWVSSLVRFTSVHGHYEELPEQHFFIADWERLLHPQEDITGAKLLINLWLDQGKSPMGNQVKEVVISKFRFKPLQ